MKIFRILLTISIALFVGLALSAYLGVQPLAPVAAMLFLSFAIPRPEGVLSVSLLDLARPTGSNPGAGGGVKSEIILIPNENINWPTFPARAADGVTVSDIPLKAGKYMHRFYMTSDAIEPSQKKAKGGNKDSGGYEISLKGFYPGLEAAVLSWIAQFGYQFEGLIIIQNCSTGTKYLIGEACNLAIVDDIQSKWGTSVDKEKGSDFTFTSKQASPLGIYSGVIKYDPSSSSW